MRHKLSLIVTLFAWFFATGSHWDLVQTFAWGKMFAAYAQTMSYADAARMTFTAENLCGVCEIVDDARQGADGQPAPAEAGTQKILLGWPTVPQVVLTVPAALPWRGETTLMLTNGRTAPPVPPPRA